MNRETIQHESAIVEAEDIGEGTQIWEQATVKKGAVIGKNCIISKGAFIDGGVVLGDGCKVKQYACLYRGAKLGNDVFIGSHVCFINDKFPLAAVWSPNQAVEVIVEDGASVGSNSSVMCGITIGKGAIIGAGSVVTKDVPSNTVYAGNPARFIRNVTEADKK